MTYQSTDVLCAMRAPSSGYLTAWLHSFWLNPAFLLMSKKVEYKISNMWMQQRSKDSAVFWKKIIFNFHENETLITKQPSRLLPIILPGLMLLTREMCAEINLV